jgi:SAM-dependent methyltransferase
MIERARANARAAGVGNVEVRKGLIERLPVDDASIDWVVSNCVINLSPQKERVFAEIARVLRPGGRLRISDIVAESLSDEARANATLVSCCLGGAVPEAAYVAGLERAGLVDVEVLERIRYDGEQLAALAGHGSPDASSCCGDLPSSGDAPTLARSLEGKVWSAVFAARRP